ncbi:MAG: transposase [Thermoguttaceae bacterium]|jgi:REP element-mobilizing transposase RayT
MHKTLGYHIVIAGYGLWLPGDERGSWSAAWDDQLGLIEPHMLHAGDPIRLRMSQERMQNSPVRLSKGMIEVVIPILGNCSSQSDWTIAAASVEMTHSHLLLTYTERDIDNTIKWIKDRTTKGIHQNTSHQGPVWCKGRWRTFIFDEEVWAAAKNYIEKHNIRRGIGPHPYEFLT